MICQGINMAESTDSSFGSKSSTLKGFGLGTDGTGNSNTGLFGSKTGFFGMPLKRDLCLSDRYHTIRGSYLSRLASFHTWPKHLPGPKPCDLALAGFYYTGSSDVTECFKCHVRVNEWNPTDGAITEHEKFSPHCPYLQYLTKDSF